MLRKNEFLSILDHKHHYRKQFNKLNFPHTLAYYITICLDLGEEGTGEIPLSKYIKYFNKSSQIYNRNKLVVSGLLKVGREGLAGPMGYSRQSIVLSEPFETEGPGPEILMDPKAELAYMDFIHKYDHRNYDPKAPGGGPEGVKRVPRAWCRAYVMDLLLRCYESENENSRVKMDFGSYVSIKTQWRARDFLAAVGRIRRDYVKIAGFCHHLKVYLEPVPPKGIAPSRHRYDRRSPKEPIRETAAA